MKKKNRRLMPFLVALAAMTFTTFLHLIDRYDDDFDLFKRLEWITYDWRAKVAANANPLFSTNIAGVFIDDEALQQLSDGSLGYNFSWPWPRFIHGQLVRELAQQGAIAVGFDVLFIEQHPIEAMTQLLGEENVPSDWFFGREIANAGNVVLAAQTGKPGSGSFPASLFRTNALAVGNILSEPDYGIVRRAKPFVDYYHRMWHQTIRDAAPAFNLNLDRPTFGEDGSIKFLIQADIEDGADFNWTVPLKPDGSLDLIMLGEDSSPTPVAPFTLKQERVWDLGIVLAARALNLDLDQALVKKRKIVLQGADGMRRVIPLDAEGYFYIDWVRSTTQITASNEDTVRDLLLFDVDRENPEKKVDWNRAFTHKLVVIGSTGTGNNISDQGSTPLEPNAFLVTKHLNVINSLLTGQFVTPYSSAIQLLFLLLLGAGSATLNWKLRAVPASLMVMALLALYVGAALVAYVSTRYWLPIALPAVSALFVYGCMVTYRVVFEQREQRHVKAVFSRLVSPNVVHELLQAESLNLGGARRNVTVFFADVRGFTKMTDMNQAYAEQYVEEHGLSGAEAEACFDRQARDTLETVNVYLATIADMIKSHDGTVDKYMGDCVMAFWGAPTANEKHALYCVQAAIAAQRAMADLNRRRAEENSLREEQNVRRASNGELPLPILPLLALGTGINSGKVTVGLMGSSDHIQNYTVFGREVNLASRLEGVSGHGRIIISESTKLEVEKYDQALADSCRTLAPVTVKGITDPVKIYEVPWRTED